MSEFDRERERRKDARPPARKAGGRGAPAFVGRVTTATASIAVGRYLLVNPVTVWGPEVEGGSGVLTTAAAPVPVLLLGPALPQTGDDLVCRLAGHRWVAERMDAATGGGGPPVGLAGCPCTDIPRNLWMHVAHQPPGVTEAVVYPSDLTYQPRPGDLSAYRSDSPGWYGSEVFESSDHFYRFRYWFGCSQGSYFVGGLMTPDSPLGFPGFFLIASYLVGVPGNTCTPFRLHAPVSGNPTFQQQGVTIDGDAPPPPLMSARSVVRPRTGPAGLIFRTRSTPRWRR